jgi:hypothetical protein
MRDRVRSAGADGSHRAGAHVTAPRWRGEAGFFEIWFLVVFDETAARAWWFRYTTFAPQDGTPRGTLWAAAFTAAAPARWGKRFVPVDEIRAAVEVLAQGRASGLVETDRGPLAWDLELRGGEGAARGPAWLDRIPAPTHVAHLRSEAVVRGIVHDDGGRPIAVEGTGALKHLWGTRRVEELYWVYCPLLDDGGAFEATSVRIRHDRGPCVAPVWLRALGREHSWWRVPGLFVNGVAPCGPGRLRVRAASATRRLDAVASCDPRTLAGYVYRDPAGWDVHVAQSDVAVCEIELRLRPHPFAPWGAPRRLVGERAAVEFHRPEPLPDVRYLPWDATR